MGTRGAGKTVNKNVSAELIESAGKAFRRDPLKVLLKSEPIGTYIELTDENQGILFRKYWKQPDGTWRELMSIGKGKGKSVDTTAVSIMHELQISGMKVTKIGVNTKFDTNISPYAGKMVTENGGKTWFGENKKTEDIWARVDTISDTEYSYMDESTPRSSKSKIFSTKKEALAEARKHIK